MKYTSKFHEWNEHSMEKLVPPSISLHCPFGLVLRKSYIEALSCFTKNKCAFLKNIVL